MRRGDFMGIRDWLGLNKSQKFSEIDGRQPKEISEDEILHEYSLYRAGYFDQYSEGIEEYTDPISLEDYKKMFEQDAQVKAGVNAIKLPILAKGFLFKHPVDENGWDGVKDLTEGHIQFLDYVFKNMTQSFDSTIQQIMTALIFGFSVSEPVYSKYVDGEYKGKIGLKKIKTLNPTTIKFKMNDYGDVLEVVQEIGEKKINIPIQKVIHYAFESNFGNPYGQSALHAIHKHWFIKNYMYKYTNMAMERQGTPLVVGVVKNKNEIPKMRSVLDNLMFRKGLAISGTDDLKVIDSTKTMDFMGYINHQNLMILRGMMIPALVFGNEGSGTGSYALGQTHFDLYLFRLQSIQREIEKLINEKIIKKLIDINFGKQEFYPIFQFKPLMEDDKNTLADVFFKLVNAQIVEPTEYFIRDAMGLPQMDDHHKKMVQREQEIKLEMKEQELKSAKLGNTQQQQANSQPQGEEDGVKASPTSNGTEDMNSHPFNSKGRGNVEEKEKKQ
jgi:phage gp29-like protein